MMVWLRNRSDKILMYYPFYCATLKNRYFIDEIFRERISQELVPRTGIYHTTDKSDRTSSPCSCTCGWRPSALPTVPHTDVLCGDARRVSDGQIDIFLRLVTSDGQHGLRPRVAGQYSCCLVGWRATGRAVVGICGVAWDAEWESRRCPWS
jgi:hypothetical protein